MRLTRRGWGVVAVAVVGVTLAIQFGPRSLNAVVLPAFIALVAAAVQLRSVDTPTVRRELPGDGFPGESGRLRVHFDGGDPFSAVVRETVPEGLSVDPPAVETTVGAAPVEFRLQFDRRGEHTLGPVQLTARDVLGLVERDVTADGDVRVLVYPPVRDLTPAAIGDLRALYDTARTAEREEFDSLREYERGDPLRDVHWKTTAKRQDLTVKQFAADSRVEAVTIAAGAEAGASPAGDDDAVVDAMAEATASIALALLSAGAPVEVHTPGGVVEAGVGRERAVLELLARANVGPVPSVDADVAIRATTDGATVSLADSTREFLEMTSDRQPAGAGTDPEVETVGTGRTGDGDGDAGAAGQGQDAPTAAAVAGPGLGATPSTTDEAAGQPASAAVDGVGDGAPDPDADTDTGTGTDADAVATATGDHDGAAADPREADNDDHDDGDDPEQTEVQA
jgi:uncharacterized protein (DUF58 family)